MAAMNFHHHHLDFSGFDRLAGAPAGAGRIYQTGTPRPGRPSLLLLPGAYHGAWCYAHYLQCFAQRGWHSVALDYPGHGALAAMADVRHGIRALADSAIAARQAIAGPVIVLGHSMGALPALLCAAATEVSGIVLLAPSPPANVPGAQALPAVAPDALRPPPTACEVRSRFLAMPEDTDVAALQTRMNPQSPQVLNDRYLLRVPVDPTRVRAPGLCIEAGLDTPDRHPPGQDRAVAECFGFDYLRLPGQPHCMMYGPRWQDSAAAILQWCQRLAPAPTRPSRAENAASPQET